MLDSPYPVAVSQVQIQIASERLDELEQDLKRQRRQQQHTAEKNRSNADDDLSSQVRLIIYGFSCR